MASKSPNWGCSPSKWPKLLINGGDPNYLRIQVAAWLAARKNWTILEVERVQGFSRHKQPPLLDVKKQGPATKVTPALTALGFLHPRCFVSVEEFCHSCPQVSFRVAAPHPTVNPIPQRRIYFLCFWILCCDLGRNIFLQILPCYVQGLGMCKVCTEAVHCVALWTRVTLGLGMCKVCTEAVHCVALWTRVTLGLGMCKVCTEAVHCVALWTRVTLGLGMCKVCTEAVHCVALWTRVTLGLGMCKVCTEAVHCVALCTRVTSSFGHVWSMCIMQCIRNCTKNAEFLSAANPGVSKNKAPPNLCFAGWKKFQTIHSLNDDFTVIDESHCRKMSKVFKNQ